MTADRRPPTADRWSWERRTRTRTREACFLDLAKDLVGTRSFPLMLTGGITRRVTAERVLGSGVAVIGTGTALAVTPDLPGRWKNDCEADRQMRPVTWSDKASTRSPTGRRSATGCVVPPAAATPRPGIHPAYALLPEQGRQRRAPRRYRARLSASQGVGA
ncbi:hypothetical protein OG520_35035 [Streptomyces sp. NBC_00984]|uniref:hypothetical protein n=1 Tax=Streptomyces sp. NBC_00984 TaxID=2903700 RepID=UPI003863BFA4|nr:hypothetical protein OG520_35035 [Streptomyces sp. NBC_00984]